MTNGNAYISLSPRHRVSLTPHLRVSLLSLPFTDHCIAISYRHWLREEVSGKLINLEGLLPITSASGFLLFTASATTHRYSPNTALLSFFLSAIAQLIVSISA
jgi:hypothetical protein